MTRYSHKGLTVHEAMYHVVPVEVLCQVGVVPVLCQCSIVRKKWVVDMRRVRKKGPNNHYPVCIGGTELTSQPQTPCTRMQRHRAIAPSGTVLFIFPRNVNRVA